MRISKYMLIGVLPLLVGPVLAEEVQLRDLSIEQSTLAQAGPSRPGSLQIWVSADRPDATYAIGETVHLTLSTNEEAYVTVFDTGPTGQVTQLFPSQYQTDNHVFANRPIEISGGTTGARITAAGPAGAELIKVIASSRPVTVVSEAQLQSRGMFRSVEGGVKTVVRDLEVVANQAAQTDTKIVFSNFALRTIASRAAPAAPAQQAVMIVPGQGSTAQPAPAPTTLLPAVAPQAPASLISVPAQQPFPLLLAADKPAYKAGDKVTLAVTTLQACNLTVMDVTPSGQVRTLFPNQTTPNNAVAAMQTVLVAGGPSAVALSVSGQAGTEQVLAICTTDPAPVALQANAAGVDRAALSRDLAIVASRPAGATATASLTFTVQP